LKTFHFYGQDRKRRGKINPNKSIMVWGGISRKGRLCLIEVDGTLNSDSYIELLN
jgi:hypothetical protein